MDQNALTRDIWAKSRHVWGVSDCVMSVGDHVFRSTGFDPCVIWRGTYSTKEGSEVICAVHGGVLGLCKFAMARFPMCEPYYGAPVVASLGGNEIAGIYFDNRVAFMVEYGMLEGRAPILAAWRI
jgi:hypothetical protein